MIKRIGIITTLVAANDPEFAARFTDLSPPKIRQKISSAQDPWAFWSALHDPSFFKFSFVRHPYSRILSCYRDKVADGASRKEKFHNLLGVRQAGRVSFSEFLNLIAQQDPRKMNRHWRPQSMLISPDVNLDFLGKFENLQDDLDEMLTRLKLPKSALNSGIGHATGVGTAKKHNFSQSEFAAMNKIYAEDFRRFGYDTNNP